MCPPPAEPAPEAKHRIVTPREGESLRIADAELGGLLGFAWASLGCPEVVVSHKLGCNEWRLQLMQLILCNRMQLLLPTLLQAPSATADLVLQQQEKR